MQQPYLAGELHLMRRIGGVGDMFAAFQLHNENAGCCPGDKHKIQVRNDRHPVSADMDAHLMQSGCSRQAECLGDAVFKPMTTLHAQVAQERIAIKLFFCRRNCRRIYLAGHGRPQAVGRLADVGHAHIPGTIPKRCRRMVLRTGVEPLREKRKYLLLLCRVRIAPPDPALLAVFETGLRKNLLLAGGIA